MQNFKIIYFLILLLSFVICFQFYIYKKYHKQFGDICSVSNDGSIKTGDKYHHFKGGEYIVVCIARDTEDENIREMVVYQDLKKQEKIWVRPLKMFKEKVDKEKYPSVEQEYRFEKIVG